MLKNITLKKRINTILALAMVFLLVLATNRIDQKHFEIAQNSVKEVYNDRVLVQDYIFSISNLLSAKQISLGDSLFKKQDLKENEEVDLLIEDFQNTKLTKKEASLLQKLQADFEDLKRLENKKTLQNQNLANLKVQMASTLVTMQTILQDLSKIQVSESRNLTNNAQNSLDMSELLSNMEIGCLIILGIVMQFILFYRVKKTS